MLVLPNATRRTLIGMAAGGGLALLPTRPGAAPVNSALDLANPTQRLRALVMMRGALDDRLAISCLSCDYYGLVEEKLTPFYKLVAATFARWRKSAAGGYEGVSYEIEYFIDPETDAVLDVWRNPYTGQRVTAHHQDSVPAKFTMDADGKMGIPPHWSRPGVSLLRSGDPSR